MICLNMELIIVTEGFRFGMDNNYRDVAFIGDCQEGVKKLVELVGWKVSFCQLMVLLIISSLSLRSFLQATTKKRKKSDL